MPRMWYYKVMIAFTYCWSRDPRKTHSSWHPRVPLKGKEEENTCCECPQSAQTLFPQVGRQDNVIVGCLQGQADLIFIRVKMLRGRRKWPGCH